MSITPYRLAAARPPIPADPYLVAWGRLRRLRIATTALMGLWLLSLPVGLRFLGSWSLFVLLPSLALILRATFRVSFFPCPRCDDWFPSYGSGSPFASHCANCGIKLATPAGDHTP